MVEDTDPADVNAPGPSSLPRAIVPGVRAVIEAGSAFEFMASVLHASDPAGRSRFTEAARWSQHASSLEPSGRRALEQLGFHPTVNLIGAAFESPGERNATDLLAHLSAMAPTDLILNAVGRYRRAILRDAPGEVIEDAVVGDPAARARFRALSWPDVPEWQRSLRFLLGHPPDELAPILVDALRQWHARAFEEEATRLVASQAREAAALRAESPTWRVDTLLRRVAPSLEYIPPAGVEVTTFVPVSSIRPVVLFLDHRMESIVLFAIADPAEADAPPNELILLGRALGDELRLRALRALAAGPRTLADLAAELGVPRTSLGHHITILRAAGLVSHTLDDGRWGRLALQPDAISKVAPLFRGFIGGGASTRHREGGASRVAR
jgi:DNA-binding transcriptional ArsR family regulator